jgi:hypothetical protein
MIRELSKINNKALKLIKKRTTETTTFSIRVQTLSFSSLIQLEIIKNCSDIKNGVILRTTWIRVIEGDSYKASRKKLVAFFNED